MSTTFQRFLLGLAAAFCAVTPLVGVADDRPSADDPLAYRQQRFARADGFLRYIDSNHNGQIDAAEVEGWRKHSMEKILQRTGVAPNFPIPITQFRAGLLDYYRLSAEQAPPPSDGSSTGSTSAAPSPGTSSGSATAGAATSASKPAETGTALVPGFGVADKLAPPLGFGVAAGANAAPGSGAAYATASFGTSYGSTSASAYNSSSTSAASSSSSNIDDRIRQYAEGLVRQYDTNKNGVLDRDEWRDIRGDPQAADTNHDGIITPAELTAYYAQKYGRPSGSSEAATGSSTGSYASSSGASGPSSASGASSSSSAGRTSFSGSFDSRRGSETANAKGYRFLTPAERLPKGLPDWFREKDGNGDGQISMAEFAKTWSESAAAEFAGYDRNGDGLLTPAEVLAKSSSSSSSSSGGGDQRSYRDHDRRSH